MRHHQVAAPGPRRRRLHLGVVLGGIGLVAALGVIAIRPWLTMREAGSATSSPATDDASKHPVRWSDESDREYALSYETRVSTKSGAVLVDISLGGPLHLISWSVEGKLALCIRFDGDIQRLAGNQAAAAGGTPSDAATIPDEAFMRAIHAPFFALYETDGTLSAVKASLDGSAIAHQLWSFLAASLQISHPRLAAAEWTAEERDSVGAYSASYRTVGSTIQRKKQQYKAGPVPGSTYTIVEGSADFHVDESRALVRFSETDELKVDGTAPMPSFESRTRITLKRTHQGVRLANLEDLKAQAARLPALDPGTTSPEALREIDRARIGGLKLSDSMARLVAAREREVAGTLSKEDVTVSGRAYVALTAMLRTQPSDIAAVRAHIEKNGPISDVLVDALRDAGTPQAQRALADILASKSPADNRLGIVRALSGVGAPTRETVAALRSVEKDPGVGTQAKYGLGSNVHRLQRSDPTQAKSVLEHLLGELAVATTNDERCTLLTALGNAGAVDTMPAILPFFQHTAAAVRACAAQAVRRIPAPDVDGVLLRALEDAEEDVRWSVIDAMSERTPSEQLASGIAREVTTELVPRVRALAIHTAARWLRVRPELGTALAVAAEKDLVEELRREAQRAIAKSAAAKPK